MPDNIIPFSTSRKRSRAPDAVMYDLLSRIDELEELLEALDELAITTRAELVAMISRLESEAASLDAPTKS